MWVQQLNAETMRKAKSITAAVMLHAVITELLLIFRNVANVSDKIMLLGSVDHVHDQDKVVEPFRQVNLKLPMVSYLPGTGDEEHGRSRCDRAERQHVREAQKPSCVKRPSGAMSGIPYCVPRPRLRADRNKSPRS